MLQREHSAILLTFIKLPFVIKIFVLSIFEWPFYTGFTVPEKRSNICFVEKKKHFNFSLVVLTMSALVCKNSIIQIIRHTFKISIY